MNTMTSQRKLIMAALMAALTTIATMILPIPSPMGAGAYIHPGDGLVLLSGILLGPIWGGAAAGIGSFLADILLSAPLYAPATLIIKTATAIIAVLVYRLMKKVKLSDSFTLLPVISAGIAGGIIVTSGYFLYESTLLGMGLAAAANIPANIVQNVFGIIISTLLLPILSRTPVVRESLS